MKEEKKETIKNLSGVAITVGLALATQGSSGLMLGVLNGIAGNLASSYIEKASFGKIKKLLEQQNPSNLNHDIQKLIIKAIGWAVKNIGIIYGEKIEASKKQKEELSSFIKILLAEIETLNDSFSANTSNSLINAIENPPNDDVLFNAFDLNLSDFPIINEQLPFPEYFKEKFQPNIQLCFGELLKDEKNRPALIAYQREVFRSLEFGIDKVIAQNNLILEKLDNRKDVEQENKILYEVKNVLKKKNKNAPDSLFIQSLNVQLKTISEQNDVIIKQNLKILDTLLEVKEITKVTLLEINQNWFEKNKVYVLLGAVFAILVISGLVYHLKSQPFNMVLNIEKNKVLNINPDYPATSEAARLRLYLPQENKEKELTFSNEIIVSSLPASLKGSSCKAELIDPFWKLSIDSIFLQSKNITISIEPNDALAIVSGRVLSRNGQLRINNAKVIVDKQQALTDDLGKFTLSIPISNRKSSYLIRIEKDGYVHAELMCYPGSDIEIRLDKKFENAKNQ